MIYRHIKTGHLYRLLLTSQDADTQEKHCVYMRLDKGWIFNRPAKDFFEKFEFVEDAQDTIPPK